MDPNETFAVRHLVALGLTPLEAEVYSVLLEGGPATGYGVAKVIGKPVANTYKAVEALQRKGAVMTEETEGKLYLPVAPGEFLEAVRTRFERHRQGAARHLKQLPTTRTDDRLYRLENRGQVLERCRAVLNRAKQIVVIDAFPRPLEEVRDAVSVAVKRGVRVAILAYQPTQVRGALVVENMRKSDSTRWNGEWINLVGDSEEFVAAYLESRGGGVRHATWSASAFLAHVLYSGILGEIGFSALARAVEDGKSSDVLKTFLRRVERHRVLRSTGRRKLMHQGE
jgi:sugar-specific transcriptional regulator TrmB